MTYIAALDPQWTDPRLDTPTTCAWCGFAGTLEDFASVTEIGSQTIGILCSCGAVTWDEVPA
jgi:hypothetical protein